MKKITVKKGNQGITLYLSVTIMTILLAMALGLNSIFVGQVKTIRAMGNSAIALTAADAGIEEALFYSTDRRDPHDISEKALANTATYQVMVIAGNESPFDDCPATYNFCIKSIGVYMGTRRAIEIVY